MYKRQSQRLAGNAPEKLTSILDKVGDGAALARNTQFGSGGFANKPGDGSAREQAASCQKVLGGFANICYEFATKRYRSNCINLSLIHILTPIPGTAPWAPWPWARAARSWPSSC